MWLTASTASMPGTPMCARVSIVMVSPARHLIGLGDIASGESLFMSKARKCVCEEGTETAEPKGDLPSDRF